MTLLTKYFKRPKIKTLISKEVKEIDNKWTKCSNCDKMIYISEMLQNNYTCVNCDFHFRMPAIKRLDLVFDMSKYQKLPSQQVSRDPLSFKDQKKYTDRIREAEKKTKLDEAIVSGFGKIGGYNSVVTAFDFSFMGGSMGNFVGANFLYAVMYSIETSSALILFTSSGGARMQEGVISLMQLPKTVLALSKLKEKKLPFIVILCDPTTGGVTASIAMLGDVHLAEPKALIGFAGQRVILETAKVELPKGFQTAEFLLKHGFIDQIVTRKETHSKLMSFLDLLMPKVTAKPQN